jgi:hypothetical protein
VEASRKRAIAVAALAVWAIVTPFMWRDLSRRPRELVRGTKWLWWLASSNVSGSVAYWLLGRKKTTSP